MGAIGGLVEILLWCIGWAEGARRVATRRFDLTDSKTISLPNAVWVALILAWTWPVLIAASYWVDSMILATFLVGPAAMTIVGCELALDTWNRRSPL